MKFVYNLLILTTLLACFNILFFLAAGFEHSISVWINYGFINLSILFPFMISVFKWKRSDVQLSAVFMACIYCVIELVAGIIMILVDPQNYLWSVMINGILFTVFFVSLIVMAMISRDVR